jgi:hypothetical protein
VGLADSAVAWSGSEHPARKAGALGGAYNGFKLLRFALLRRTDCRFFGVRAFSRMHPAVGCCKALEAVLASCRLCSEITAVIGGQSLVLMGLYDLLWPLLSCLKS